MVSVLIFGMAMTLALITITVPAFGDSASASMQNTISDDIENNPIAQDILKKIEKSKKWIMQIEQRNFESLERQKELEQKRAETLKILEDKLEKWEKVWEYYTFDKKLERVLESSSTKDTDSMYDHPLKFTASKIHAGRDALHKILLEGGGPEEARDAFVNAAKITREEMFAANSIFNVMNGNAYYNQQILFSPDGSFEDTVSGEQLRKYYQDYRTDPEYLQANPFDKVSWTDLSKNNPDAECRQDMVLVYRNHAEDYVCITSSTAEMWSRHNMGSIVTNTLLETRDPPDVEKFRQDRINQKVESLNAKILSMQKYDGLKISETEAKYDKMFAGMKTEQGEEEESVIREYNESDSMTSEEFSQQITGIRERYDGLETMMDKERSRIIEILEEQHQQNLNDFLRIHESDFEIKVTWDLHEPRFEANT